MQYFFYFITGNSEAAITSSLLLNNKMAILPPHGVCGPTQHGPMAPDTK